MPMQEVYSQAVSEDNIRVKQHASGHALVTAMSLPGAANAERVYFDLTTVHSSPYPVKVRSPAFTTRNHHYHFHHVSNACLLSQLLVWNDRLPQFEHLVSALRDGRVIALINAHPNAPPATQNSMIQEQPCVLYAADAFTCSTALPNVSIPTVPAPHPTLCTILLARYTLTIMLSAGGAECHLPPRRPGSCPTQHSIDNAVQHASRRRPGTSFSTLSPCTSFKVIPRYPTDVAYHVQAFLSYTVLVSTADGSIDEEPILSPCKDLLLTMYDDIPVDDHDDDLMDAFQARTENTADTFTDIWIVEAKGLRTVHGTLPLSLAPPLPSCHACTVSSTPFPSITSSAV